MHSHVELVYGVIIVDIFVCFAFKKLGLEY